jgi:hypothetical protein
MLIVCFSLPGLGLILFGYLLRNTEGIWGELPWGLVGGIFFLCAIGLVRWRGAVSTAWKAVEFGTPGTKLGIDLHGAGCRFETLFPSIAGFLRAGKTGRYYKDDPDGSYGGFGGHEVRLIDREVAYCTNPEKALMAESLSKDGFYDWETVEDAVKKKMVSLKTDDGRYVLNGSTTDPPNILNVDIKGNPAHKELFEFLCNDYFIKVHGRTFSLKHYHRFQERQAAPIQVGIIIYYAKALAAMRAAKVKVGMGGAWLKLIAVFAAIFLILIFVFMMATGQISL